jgi:hypothetical protein
MDMRKCKELSLEGPRLDSAEMGEGLREQLQASGPWRRDHLHFLVNRLHSLSLLQ